MTHRGPFQPLLFCDSVILWPERALQPSPGQEPVSRPRAAARVDVAGWEQDLLRDRAGGAGRRHLLGRGTALPARLPQPAAQRGCLGQAPALLPLQHSAGSGTLGAERSSSSVLTGAPPSHPQLQCCWQRHSACSCLTGRLPVQNCSL